ncbi:MFS transporter [Yinghuangia seranimata]|uniref:MFS transporter n=1 Tax=Yinghuangia seranimata TaxID=408067 RepID=UPI00248CC594|nr:MFS transporter [Yinghuangia seranimata]MDI2128352.1 MFS transporter [Yinghuangia seranimata]
MTPRGPGPLVTANLAITLVAGARYVLCSWIVLQISGIASAPVWLLVAEMLPGLLFTRVLGAVIDRYDRRRVALAADAVRGAALASVAVLSAVRGPSVGALVVLAAVMGTCDQLSTPARTALLRALVADDALLGATTRISMSTQLGTLSGVGLGGLAAAHVAPATAFAALAGCHAVSAAALACVRTAPADTKTAPKTAGTAGTAAATEDDTDGPGPRPALAQLRAAGGLRSPFIVVVVLSAFLRTYNSLLPAFADKTLGLDSVRFAVVDAAFAVGSLAAGGVLLGRGTSAAVQRAAHLGLAALAGCTALFALSGGFASAATAYAAIGAGFQTLTLYQVRCQALVPLEHYGRVFAAFTRIGTIAVLVLYALVGVALAWTGPIAVYLLLALALAGLAVLQRTAAPFPLPGTPEATPAEGPRPTEQTR